MQLAKRQCVYRCLRNNVAMPVARPVRNIRARAAVAPPMPETPEVGRTMPEDMKTPAPVDSVPVPETVPATEAALAENVNAEAPKPAEPVEAKPAEASKPEVNSEVPAPAKVEAAAQEAQPEPEIQETTGFKNAVMIQAYGWDSCKQEDWYGQIAGKAKEMKDAGFTHVWLPPPSQSVSAQGFMPGQLYNLTSKYGNKETLMSCLQALKGEGLKGIADIVINHRCADEKGSDGVYNNFKDDVDHTGKKLDWGAWAITGNDPNFKGQGNPDSGDDYGPAPDLDHANPELRAALTEWLAYLKNDVGYNSWRLDFAKGYAAKFVKEYIDATSTAQELNVGEVWVDCKWNDGDLDRNQDEARQKLCDWIKDNGKTCTAFDFPTKGILNETMKNTQYDRLKDSNGKAPGLMGWWPAMAVTFIANHDTDSTENHWPFPKESLEAGYAYILTHPGMPCVFWDHMFKYGDDMAKCITVLLAIRSRNGVVSDSKLEILTAENDMYVARIGGRVVVKLGPRHDMGDLVPKEEEGWASAGSGKDWAVWEKAQ